MTEPHHVALWRTLRGAVGKQPTVSSVKFGDSTDPFDLATATDAPRVGVSLYATLKLSDSFPSPAAPVRYELASACQSRMKKFPDVVSFAGHLALDNPALFEPGAVRETIVRTRYSRATAGHFLVTARPLLGVQIPDVRRDDGATLRWLYLVPITSEEALAVERRKLSVAELEDVLEVLGPMLFDLERESGV